MKTNGRIKRVEYKSNNSSNAIEAGVCIRKTVEAGLTRNCNIERQRHRQRQRQRQRQQQQKQTQQ
ncbi:uncharacterized protein Dvir_GJ26437 [Drosophila virilis]|uniref:Uncharacterized protein n=1 Tax=Drosophila virilis TaxID=7244 RepID=A0A0Q9WE43_DROVI|nr:uncharacterized protein Dvir_GJ26437 [Drosophila virilis]